MTPAISEAQFQKQIIDLAHSEGGWCSMRVQR